jgi:hypothetical protein
MRKLITLPAAIAIIVVVAGGLAITGCQEKGSIRKLSDAEIETAAKKQQEQHVDSYARSMWAESQLPQEQADKIKKEIEAGFKKSVDIWLAVTDSPDSFEKGMTGAALEELKQQFADELEQGKIKIRVHDDQEFDVVKIDKEYGAVAYAYTDNGYYVDAKTRKKISNPINEKKEWLVGVVKAKDTWKISGIYPLRPKVGPQ